MSSIDETPAREPFDILEDSTLGEGDVAVLLRKNGGMQIAHNIPMIKLTQRLSPGPESAAVILGLAMIEVVENDDAAFQAAMIRVVTRLSGPGALRLIKS